MQRNTILLLLYLIFFVSIKFGVESFFTKNEAPLLPTMTALLMTLVMHLYLKWNNKIWLNTQQLKLREDMRQAMGRHNTTHLDIDPETKPKIYVGKCGKTTLFYKTRK